MLSKSSISTIFSFIFAFLMAVTIQASNPFSEEVENINAIPGVLTIKQTGCEVTVCVDDLFCPLNNYHYTFYVNQFQPDEIIVFNDTVPCYTFTNLQPGGYGIGASAQPLCEHFPWQSLYIFHVAPCCLDLTCSGELFSLQGQNDFEDLIDCSATICQGEAYVFRANVDGAPQNYDYNWSNNAQPYGGNSNFMAIATDPGIYSVTVTNGEGCAGVLDFELFVEPCCQNPLTLSCSGELFYQDGHPNTTELPDCEMTICEGEAYFFQVNPENGTPGYDYNWSDNAIIYGTNYPYIAATEAGIYSVTVTDAEGCSAVQEFELFVEPAEIEVSDDVNFTMGWFVGQSGSQGLHIEKHGDFFYCNDCCSDGFSNIESKTTIYFANGGVLISRITNYDNSPCNFFDGIGWSSHISCNLINRYSLQVGDEFYGELEILSYETDCTITDPLAGVIYSTPIYVLTQEDLDRCGKRFSPLRSFSNIDKEIEERQILIHTSTDDFPLNQDILSNRNANFQKTSVFPTLFSSEFKINHDATETGLYELTLVDIQGKIIQQQKGYLDKGSNTIVINDLDNLPPSIYFAKFKIPNQVVKAFKVIKQTP